MREIALHVLDIAQNSVRAGASLLRVTLLVDRGRDRLTVEVEDNGSGMSEEVAARVADPFYTSRSTRRVGLGLSLLQAGAESTGGSFALESRPGAGTRVTAEYVLSSIDRPPIGDFAGTVHSLMHCCPELDFVVRVQIPEQPQAAVLDTRDMRALMGDLRLDEPEVSAWIGEKLHSMFPDSYTGL